MSQLINSLENVYTRDEVASFGRQFLKWMEDASARGCLVQSPITLRLDHLPQPPWVVEYVRHRLRPDENEIVAELNPNLVEPHFVTRDQTQFNKVNVWNSVTSTTWMGWVGPAVILIEAIGRIKNSGDPNIPALTKAIYSHTYDIETLMAIVFCDVINQETTRIFREHIEPRLSRRQDLFEFRRNLTRDREFFELLLGTEIGRVAARFVLGVWGQGEKWVDTIVVRLHPASINGPGPRLILYMRFDIASLDYSSGSELSVKTVVPPPDPAPKASGSGGLGLGPAQNALLYETATENPWAGQPSGYSGGAFDTMNPEPSPGASFARPFDTNPSRSTKWRHRGELPGGAGASDIQVGSGSSLKATDFGMIPSQVPTPEPRASARTSPSGVRVGPADQLFPNPPGGFIDTVGNVIANYF